MFTLTCNITIGLLKFNYVTELEIVSAWEEMTDTCTIKLPRKLKVKELELVNVIKAGDPVKVELGYNGELRTEFVGYVRELRATIPVEVICEDSMYLLKKKAFSLSLPKGKLDDLLSEIYDGPLSVNEIEMGPFRTEKKMNGVIVLEQVKEQYGLRSFFRSDERGEPVLTVGKVYADSPDRFKYAFGKNVIENSLEFKRKEDVRIKVKAINYKDDNSKVEVELGDPDGEERTLSFYNIDSKSELEARAKEELDRLKYDGYRGSIKTFGVPACEHGDIAEINDPNYPERSGSFFIDKVVKTFGINGYRREVTLGPKA